MVKIEAVLHPEEAALVWTMLNHAATQLAHQPSVPPVSDSTTSRTSAPASDTQVSAARAPDDSAESQPTQQPRVPGVRSQVGSLAAPDARTGTHEAAVHDMSDDSAESHATAQLWAVEIRSAYGAVARHGAALSTREAAVHGMSDDSAESHATAHLRAPEVSSANGAQARVPERGSPRDNTLPCIALSSARDTAVVHDEIGASVERHSGIPEDTSPRDVDAVLCAEARSSLLEQLLDEAEAVDAVRDVGITVSRDDLRAAIAVVPRGPSVLRQQVDAVKRAFNRADALVSLAQAYLRGDKPERAPIELTIAIAAASLRAEPADPLEVGEIAQTLLSPDAVRRLSCDAGVVEIIENEHGAPLSVGRKRRTIAGALKRALRKRDTVCTYPGCTNRLFLEGHHVKHWVDGGEASLLNITMICSFHHRFVHEYGYQIEMGPDQRPQFRDPQGRLVPAVPAQPDVADLGWATIRARNAPLAIDASTITCGWDGRPVDHEAVIGHLVAADRLC